MNLTGPRQTFPPGGTLSSFGVSSGVALAQPGDIGYDALGRRYRYVRAGAGGALVAGNAIQMAAVIPNHLNCTPIAAALGQAYIDVTLGATALDAGYYAYGSAIIDTTPGLGYSYGVSGHLAALSGGTVRILLMESETIQVALTTSSRVSLVANPWGNVIQMPVTTLTGSILGVAVYPIAAGEYGWIGVNGPFGTLIAGTPAVGQGVGGPSAAAGALDINSSTEDIVGTMMSVGVDGRVVPVLWNKG